MCLRAFLIESRASERIVAQILGRAVAAALLSVIRCLKPQRATSYVNSESSQPSPGLAGPPARLAEPVRPRDDHDAFSGGDV